MPKVKWTLDFFEDGKKSKGGRANKKKTNNNDIFLILLQRLDSGKVKRSKAREGGKLGAGAVQKVYGSVAEVQTVSQKQLKDAGCRKSLKDPVLVCSDA